jgi:uncharacterized protein with FMN-binding domain
MEPENKSNKKLGITLSVIIAVAVIGVVIFMGRNSSEVASVDTTSGNSNGTIPQIPISQPTPAPTPTATPTPVAEVPKSTSVYKDGTYSATGSYMSPGGADQIGVTLTLRNDIITAVSVNMEPGDNTSARYQNKFFSGYKQYVLGKNIADVNLTKVSGSSLTPRGFDDALAQIKAQAQA